MTNLYTNYKSTGEWDKQGADQQKVLIALATALKQERAKNKKQSTDARAATTANTNAKTGKAVIPEWKFKNVGKITKCPVTGDKFEWCPHHGRKDENGKQKGMYMPFPHFHDDWLAKKKRAKRDWEEKQAMKRKRERETDASLSAPIPKKNSSVSKLSLAKSFKSALATHMFSDQEANQLVDDVLSGKFDNEGQVKD